MNVYEFIGIIIGDGNILYSKEKRYYRLEITGNATDDIEFFNKISNFMKMKWKVNPKIITRILKNGRGLKLYIYNKNLIKMLIEKYNLPYGNKTYTVSLPKKYLNWRFSKHIVRGVFDTDGSLFFSKSKVFEYPTYPRIEIRSSSPKLVSQVVKILKTRKYKVQLLKPKNYNAYKIYLSGSEMLEKWVKEIGFSNIKNKTKYLFWKKYGYYMPRISFKKRLELLDSVGI